MSSDYIYLIVGKSGSGKSTLVDKLEKEYGFKSLKSYTDRPIRNDKNDINTHTFISRSDFNKLCNICAYTKFAGHRYCATSEQVDEADIYVIDPAGIDYFKENYTGKKTPIVIEILAQKKIRKDRMKKRGDSWWQIHKRLRNDKRAFANVKSHYVLNGNKHIDDVAREAASILKGFGL